MEASPNRRLPAELHAWPADRRRPSEGQRRRRRTRGRPGEGFASPPPRRSPAATRADRARPHTCPPSTGVMGRPESPRSPERSWSSSGFGCIAAGDSGCSRSTSDHRSVVSAYLARRHGACLLMTPGFDLSLGSMIRIHGNDGRIPPLFFGWPVWLFDAAALAARSSSAWVNGTAGG